MKYELTNESIKVYNKTLYKIRALKSFGSVKSGDLGGFVESSRNLCQEGDAWVFDNAKVFGYAWVYGNAQVCGNALVSGDAWVFDNAQVFGNALVSGDARVFGNAQVYGNTWVSGDTRVYGNAQVCGNAWVCGDSWLYGDVKVEKTPLVISGPLKHNITITQTHIFIGCEGHPIEYWRFNIRKIGEKHGYTKEQINKTIALIKAMLRSPGGKAVRRKTHEKSTR